MTIPTNERAQAGDSVSFGRYRIASPTQATSANDSISAVDGAQKNERETDESKTFEIRQIEEAEQGDEEDAFFAKSFASDARESETEISDAFVGGLRNLFDSDDADEELDSDEELSESERFQRETELERREALDAAVLQNDVDFLYESGEKYERSQVRTHDVAPGAGEGNERKRDRAVGACENEDAARVAIRTESVLEAMLFVGDRENKPLTLARACELMRDVTETEALETLADLNERYFREGAPYKIARQGDGYALVLRSEFADVAARFGGKTKEFKLSQPAIDVLALVAYRQPITLDEILEVRGNAGGVLTQLVKRDLISVEKKTLDNKKISFYKTTERFLKIFNLNSLDDLPIVGDVDYR